MTNINNNNNNNSNNNKRRGKEKRKKEEEVGGQCTISRQLLSIVECPQCSRERKVVKKKKAVGVALNGNNNNSKGKRGHVSGRANTCWLYMCLWVGNRLSLFVVVVVVCECAHVSIWSVGCCSCCVRERYRERKCHAILAPTHSSAGYGPTNTARPPFTIRHTLS